MRKSAMAVVVVTLASAAARSAEPASFSPAALVSRQTAGGHPEFFIAAFPPGGKEFEILLPLMPRWFAYGPSGRVVYTTALREAGTGSFTDQRGLFKIELDPVRVSAIQGLDSFGSIGPFAVSQREDLVVFGGSKGDNYPARSCGVYGIRLPAGDTRAVTETSDCRAGSPWRVLSLSPEGTEALISANRKLALLDLSKGTITPIDGQLSGGSFSPDGRWIAALQLGDPKAPSKTVLIDRTNLSSRRDLGGVDDAEVVWSPNSRYLLHAVYRPACPSEDQLALETLEVQTGTRSLIKESICNSGSSRQIGWVRSDLKR
ncbi:MAG TPA: hypothetical protein VME17_03360 [Bryobacteraceae bacterium]|nr:hypothetical protein [Bryobacteraceae bacterium]